MEKDRTGDSRMTGTPLEAFEWTGKHDASHGTAAEAEGGELQGSWTGGGLGGTHLRKASRLLRKGKKEGSQIRPWSRQASVQALPGAASQARRE